MATQLDPRIRQVLARGTVIPAHPLALTAERRFDERRQRALTRYYVAAGAGGLAVGVHTTQFAIREPRIGLFAPVLKLAAEEMDRADCDRAEPLIRIGGICGATSQAVREAALLKDLGYSAGLLSLAAMKDSNDTALLAHCRTVSEILPIIGFYLQPAVGGCVLSYRFWREFAEIENVVAVKIAPFNRYQTLDVVRAVAESGRDIALYTGNDDNIALDLLTPFVFQVNGRVQERRIVGGLLGHWAVWTRRAVEFLDLCHAVAHEGGAVSKDLLQRSTEITDSNAAFFDATHHFAGCIAGLHEVLRRQGLLEGIWCLDPRESLSPGQQEEISRVLKAYPHLNDDDFVCEGRHGWLRP
ncbi:MAG: dihydrodipicolinate synthase family protein [Acidobacteria bacterium]|nr:MAG: dihydrodipicolinate synthase family protein [Acidobacteriota bacterium]